MVKLGTRLNGIQEAENLTLVVPTRVTQTGCDFIATHSKWGSYKMKSPDFLDMDKVAKFWDENLKLHKDPPKLSWLDSSIILHDCLNTLPIDDQMMSVNHWLLWFKKKYIPKVLECGLSLGCGDGTLERHAISMEIVKKMVAYDCSQTSLETAEKINEAQGLKTKISLQACDLNKIHLKKNIYDVVFSNMLLHHIKNLENLCCQVQKSLKSGGLFILNEYVGPSQFQLREKQIKIINDLIKILPEHLRIDSITGSLKEICPEPTIEYMNDNDPSEAIRSSEIIDILQNDFKIIGKFDYGGNILHKLMENIIDNFDEENKEHIAILKMVHYVEKLLISENIMSADFSVIVARK